MIRNGAQKAYANPLQAELNPDNYMWVRGNKVIEDADCMMTITGSAMWPLFKDGEQILIQFTETLEPGEIGIFMDENGKALIRQYYENTLVSFRPDLESVHYDPRRDYKIAGRVLCVMTPEMYVPQTLAGILESRKA